MYEAEIKTSALISIIDRLNQVEKRYIIEEITKDIDMTVIQCDHCDKTIVVIDNGKGNLYVNCKVCDRKLEGIYEERHEKEDECKHCNETEGLEICCSCGNKICDDHSCQHLNQIYCSMYCLNMGRIEGMMR